MTSSFVHYLGGESHLGASALIGESQNERRFLSGMYGVLKLSEHWIGEFELDWEKAHLAANTSDEVDTVASFLKLANKPVKGLFWYLLFEHSTQDSEATGFAGTNSPGIGIQWLPFPHFDVQIEYQRTVLNSNPGNENHTGFMMFHFYP